MNPNPLICKGKYRYYLLKVIYSLHDLGVKGTIAKMPVTVDHVAIIVPHLVDAVPLFSKLLGIDPEPLENVPERQVIVQKFKLPNLILEIFEPYPEAESLQNFLQKKGPGLHHLSLSVPDILSFSDTLVQKGFSLLYSTPQTGANQAQVNFLPPKQIYQVLIEIQQNKSLDAEGQKCC